MKTIEKKITLALVSACLSLNLLAQTTIASWDFGTTATTTTPSVGSGTFSLIGGTAYDPDKTGFAPGVATSVGVLETTATASVSGWGYTAITFPAQGKNSKTAGIQINLSTVGYQNITFSADVRHGNKCANTTVLQYTVNGTDWVDATTYVASVTNDTWFLRTYDFSSISAVNNNAKFAIRFVSAFASGTSSYAPSNSTSSYDVAKGYRFDNIVFKGNAINSSVDDTKTISWKQCGNKIVFGEELSDVIRVYDLSGNLVLTQSPTKELNLNYPKGIYFVKVADAVKKIILK